MRRFGASDFPLGTTAPRDEVMDQLLIKRSLFGYSSVMTAENLAKRLNFGAPITVPRSHLARKKAKPPKAGGKRRRWKKDRAAIADLRRVFKRSVDELRHLTANALGFAEVAVTVRE